MLEQLLSCLAKVETLEKMLITEVNASVYKTRWKKKLAYITTEFSKRLGLDSEHQEEIQRHSAEILGSVEEGN